MNSDDFGENIYLGSLNDWLSHLINNEYKILQGTFFKKFGVHQSFHQVSFKFSYRFKNSEIETVVKNFKCA